MKGWPLMHNLIEKPIWLAVDKSGRIRATWYRGCAQPFAKWRKAVKLLGWRPIHSTVLFYV